MIKLRFALCILFIMIVNMAFSPMAVVAGSKEDTIKQYTQPKEKDPASENRFIRPRDNIDPKMVIPGDPGIDPEFIIDYQP